MPWRWAILSSIPPRYIARRIVYTIMRNCWERHCARYRNENVSLADLRAANSQHRYINIITAHFWQANLYPERFRSISQYSVGVIPVCFLNSSLLVNNFIK